MSEYAVLTQNCEVHNLGTIIDFGTSLTTNYNLNISFDCFSDWRAKSAWVEGACEENCHTDQWSEGRLPVYTGSGEISVRNGGTAAQWGETSQSESMAGGAGGSQTESGGG